MTTENADKQGARTGDGLEALARETATAVLRDLDLGVDYERGIVPIILAAISRLQPSDPGTWQPIESAPRDRHILLWSTHWRDGGKPATVPAIAVWSSMSACYVDMDGEIYKPTHWRELPPLPAPPTQETR
jgi:hypothetical protein